MLTAEVSLRGVKRRKTSGAPYFEMRYGDGKFYSTKIKSAEEGGLCYDIAQRYSELETVGGKRKAPTKLNYPEYSRSLQLESLPSDFDIQRNKEAAMEIILRQAQAAARNLPESLKRSIPVVGCQSPTNRSSSHQNVHDNPPRVVEGKQDLRGVCTNIDVQNVLLEMSELSYQCYISWTLKALERGELEIKMADIREDSGIIRLPKSCPDKFHYHMACFKRLISTDEKIPWQLEMAEQRYKSEESKCLELRKLLEDHNLKSIPGSLMGDGNKMTGRQRENENERLPEVLEICPPEEQNECSVPVDVSECYAPAIPLVVVRPYRTDITMPPAEMDMSQRVAPYELDTCYRREDEDGRLVEVCVNSNAWMPVSRWSPDDSTDSDDWTRLIEQLDFSHEDPVLFAPGCG